MRALIPRLPRRTLTVTALVVALALGSGIWLTQRGSPAGAAPGLSVKATLGDVILSVGGVGRIVTGTAQRRSTYRLRARPAPPRRAEARALRRRTPFPRAGAGM